MRGRAAFLIGFSLVGASVRAIDWTMYRGPDGNGIVSEAIQTEWPPEGPKLLWRVPLTNGLSSVTVSQGRVFTQVHHTVANRDTEFCLGLDASDGKIVWAQPVDIASYPSGGVGRGDDGPRTTPVVKDGRVFVCGSYLDLHCFDAQSGTPIWHHDLRSEYGAVAIPWQNAASPVIEGDNLYLNCNGSSSRILCLRLSDGGLVWKGFDDAQTHATPVPATIQGVRQLIFLTQSGLLSVEPVTGKELWRYAFPYSISTAASPVVQEDMVYCSAAYGVGAAGVRVSKQGSSLQASELWRQSGALMNHWSTPATHGGFVFGLYGQELRYTAPLKCVDMTTGEEKWSMPGFGLGATLRVGDYILVAAESGDIVLVRPDPAGYQEAARFKAVADKVWNSPAISDGRLYVRSTTELAVFDISLPKPQPLQLLAPAFPPGGGVRLEVVDPQGRPIDAPRLAGIEVLFSESLDKPLTEWMPLTTSPRLENGHAVFDDPDGAGLNARYYLVRERL